MTNGFPTWPELPEAPRGGNRRWLLAVVLLLVVAGGSGFAWWQYSQSATGTATPEPSSTVSPDDSSARPPGGTRVVVRIVNMSGVRGLARRATLLLRDFGYDVVDYDSQPKTERPSTEILVHKGQTDLAERLQRALGVGTFTPSNDTSRYVDLTVLLGRDWQPPTEPLRP
ncbi:MAG TPA: LytR C-terminal domain-containing protein [Gemmatimonas sp.]|uniref:LytR C-terminal domain-containing protein n=1 Tax=Gemmatimonas sp. TaxID=1962908 RepID=UPI002EDA448F